MASAAAAISHLSATNPGSLPSNGTKLEPVPGTAKIIHPDEDISLVSINFNLKSKQKHFCLIFFRKNFVLLYRNINK
jgi:hypothetical protein